MNFEKYTERARGFREIPRIALQRVISALGRRRIGRASLAQILDCGIELLRRDSAAREDLACLALLLDCKRE